MNDQGFPEEGSLDPDNVLGCEPGSILKFNVDRYVCPKCGVVTETGFFHAQSLDSYYVNTEGILYRLYLPTKLRADCSCSRGFFLTSIVPVPFSAIQELDAKERREQRGETEFLNA